jgi:hypothetical protein
MALRNTIFIQGQVFFMSGACQNKIPPLNYGGSPPCFLSEDVYCKKQLREQRCTLLRGTGKKQKTDEDGFFKFEGFLATNRILAGMK